MGLGDIKNFDNITRIFDWGKVRARNLSLMLTPGKGLQRLYPPGQECKLRKQDNLGLILAILSTRC